VRLTLPVVQSANEVCWCRRLRSSPLIRAARHYWDPGLSARNFSVNFSTFLTMTLNHRSGSTWWRCLLLALTLHSPVQVNVVVLHGQSNDG